MIAESVLYVQQYIIVAFVLRICDEVFDKSIRQIAPFGSALREPHYPAGGLFGGV